MSLRRGMRVVCVWDAALVERGAANFARCFGVTAATPEPGAVYLIEDLVECWGWLWLRLAGKPWGQVYRADGFRPVVEGEAELGRLRAIAAGTPAPAEVRETEPAA